MHDPTSRGAALVLTAAAMLAGCASQSESVPVVEPYTVRFELSAAYATRPHGVFRASEDVNEGFLKGDRVDLRKDMGLSGSGGLDGAIEARITADDEARLAFRALNEFDGESNFDKPRRFDGRTYVPGDQLETRFKWTTASASYARRIAAIRGDGAPETDVLARLGVERDQFHGALDENRFILASAPFLGLDTRTRLCDDTTLLLAADAGVWKHEGQQMQMADASVGVRQHLVGALDVTLTYQISLRDASVHRSDLEQSQARFVAHVLSLALGLEF